jgi:NAD(P)-dependent dehydrogenase (short-subunit alcohol dehydrogenase family)
MRLENHVALVTGGSRGIGRAIVQWLALEGASVMFTGRNPETGLELEKTLRDVGLTVRFVTADSAREADVRRAVESAIETSGGPRRPRRAEVNRSASGRRGGPTARPCRRHHGPAR